MKPTNLMAQLEQWKKNNGKSNETQIGSVKGNKLNIEPVKSAVKLKFEKNQNANLHSVENTQGNEHSAPKAKYQGKLFINPLVAEYNQITRQFKLIHDSNRKCLEVYPNDFHHKVKMRGECADLVERLKGGGKLFNELAKASARRSRCCSSCTRFWIMLVTILPSTISDKSAGALCCSNTINKSCNKVSN